jgi:hypothetical protein
MFISAGMIVGFDQDDATIFDEQFEFLQKAQIPLAMLSFLVAVPKTPLYQRLQAEGRLVTSEAVDFESSGVVGTAGGTNFHPRLLTREELKTGQEQLYKRLYAPKAFAARVLGNLARFRDVRFRPEPFQFRSLGILSRLIGAYWRNGPAARKFFWGCLWQTLRTAPRMFGQMVITLGMYLHFCKVRSKELGWNPWRTPQEAPPQEAPPRRAISQPADTEADADAAVQASVA